jgi:inosine-uridine nucleoside N-ribohydrolase
MASRHRGELVLATIGPETNIALALRREPRLRHWLAEIAVMGGSTGNGNVTAAAEWNIHCDPEAAWAVFASGIPIRMVGLNVTRVTGLEQGDIDRLRGSGRKVAGVIADLLEFYLARQREGHGIGIAPMHDVCAVLPYAYPGLIDYAHVRVEIELTGTHTRGMTLCDLRPAALAAGPKRAPPPNAQVAVGARSRDIVGRVIETLLSYP